jgi:hypothetical protein
LPSASGTCPLSSVQFDPSSSRLAITCA